MKDVGVYWMQNGMVEGTQNVNGIVNRHFHDRHNHAYYIETDIINKLHFEYKLYGGNCKTLPKGVLLK